MTLNWLEMRRATSSRDRVEEETRTLRLTRENACLMQDNARLRSEFEDLAASTNTWIRLYEAALERANTAAAESSRRQQPAGQC
jgi:hypothetical protein